MTLGQKITSARKQKGWTQGELGDLVDVASGLIGKYERGETNPPLEVASKIAKMLDCSLDYLAGNVEENAGKAKSAIPAHLVPLINKLEKLSSADKAHITAVIDAFIGNANSK
jgi:transcriptional regulator with XRE-family HTH domain